MQRLQVLAVCHYTHVMLRDDTYSSAINLIYLKSQYGKAEKEIHPIKTILSYFDLSK